ncbi:MAG: HEAT repeat domain-containing protein [Treponema sp.]|jgi:HEAT repeat protein|nr:HEAT repeat domain-containing protein [Treponema sp.]
MKTILALFFCFAALGTPRLVPAQEASPGSEDSANEQRLKIIQYGTDAEIANLIKTLRGERDREGEGKDQPLDEALLTLAGKTKNRTILSGVFSYFGDRERGGLENRAREAVENRDYEAVETVNAALDYLGKVQAAGTKDILSGILQGEESRFLPGAIRALGKTAEKDGAAGTAEYLIDYYSNLEPGNENRGVIIEAIGNTKAKEGTGFLVSIAENEDERTPLRIAALEGLAKIADPEGLDAILTAASSKDPNVRAAAIGAMGPFSGQKTEEAIIEAFRDSYYRTRVAAAKAAGERKLAGALPFLRFRSENDDVPAVRDEAVKAMGAIGGADAEKNLADLFRDRKNNDRIRINAGEALLTKASADYTQEVINEMDEAKLKNQTALYNGFLRVLGPVKSPKLESLARRFFAGGGVIEKSYALDFCSNNNFRGLADEIRKLTGPKNGNLSRKALAILEKWGLPVESPQDSPGTPTTSAGPADGPPAPPRAGGGSTEPLSN